jgi:hypothetical protein
VTQQPVSGPSDPNVPNAASQDAAGLQKLYGISGATPADPGNPNNNAGTPSGVSDPHAVSITVNGRTYTVEIVKSLDPGQAVSSKRLSGGGRAFEDLDQDIVSKIAEIESWYGNSTKRAQIVQQLYAAGLVTSKKAPSAAEVINAWALVVQEAATQSKAGNFVSPEDLLAKAAKTGWNSVGATLTPDSTGAVGTGNLNNAADASTTTSSTIYKSYLDPATIMGAQADAWFRLLGRNPTKGEYNAFLNSILQYQDESNTGKFESQTKDPSDKLTGSAADTAAGLAQAQSDPTSQTSIVSQRGVGTRGLEFLAGQAAMANPEEGAYQAATTYFNAFIKALSGPAAGMQASGPTNTAP